MECPKIDHFGAETAGANCPVGDAGSHPCGAQFAAEIFGMARNRTTLDDPIQLGLTLEL
jgi:hypothetical protein